MILIYNPPQFPIATLGPKSNFLAERVSEITGFRYGGRGRSNFSFEEVDELEVARRRRAYRRGLCLGRDFGDVA